MTDHINRPFQVPTGLRNPSLLSRGDIMGTSNGKHPWTMFMPGQSSGRHDEYPTEWPNAGRLIRVPKCVFLTSCPPAHLWGENFTLVSKWAPFGYLGHWHDMTLRDTRYTQPTVGAFGTEIFGGFSGGYSYIGWTIDPQYPPALDQRRGFHRCCVVPNAIYAEHNRLVAEFEKAKEILETRYPQNVFVHINEAFPSEPATTIAPNDELQPKVFDVYTEDGRRANRPKSSSTGPPWVLGPDAASVNYDFDRHGFVADFFGTDFLHFYCGYQATGEPGVPPSADDVKNRSHWFNQSWGYKLDENFGPGFDQWIVYPGDQGGYEDDSYAITLHSMNGALGSSTSYAQAHASPAGKADYLRVGFANFSGYRVALHEYDCVWNFPTPSFLPSQGPTEMPPHAVDYGDQDWVEQVIVLGYEQRKATYLASPAAAYGDEYFPGPGGTYNHYNRYPPTSAYHDVYVPQLNAQRDQLKKEVEALGPKTAEMWGTLIDRHNLGELGISYEGGSSRVTADYIVAFVEDHYGLTPP